MSNTEETSPLYQAIRTNRENIAESNINDIAQSKFNRKIKTGKLTGKRGFFFQTWKTHQVPDKWRPSPVSVEEHMNDWDYRLMTDEDNRRFVAEHCPDFLPYYDTFPHNIQRADAIRYIVFAYTARSYDFIVYMDLDIELLHPLNELIKDDLDGYFVSSGNLGNWQTNSLMIGKPGSKIWLEMIEEMKKSPPWWAFTKHFQVMATTGPIALSRVLRNTKVLWGRLPASLLMPCSVCDKECNLPGIWAKPLEGQSWCGWDSHSLNWLLCNWKPVACILTLLLIAFFIMLIYKAFYQKM